MGGRAEVPSKLKLRNRTCYRCDICAKKCLSAQALKSHRVSVHRFSDALKPTRGKPRTPASRTDKEIIRPNTKTALDVPPTVAVVPNIEKPQFGCPKCSKVFPVYFSAYKHIQKNHCENSLGEKVSPSSSDIIKPVKITKCQNCDVSVRSDQTHICTLDVKDVTFVCAACKQHYTNIYVFDLHVGAMHSDEVESYFFPTNEDYNIWKKHVEEETKIQYVMLSKSGAKQIYRCSYLPNSTDSGEDMAYLCPSNITVREYPKGIQAHFYKKHYGHECIEYKTPEHFKKFNITLKGNLNFNEIDLSDEADLYVQFKSLMDSIVVDAAKVNINTLKLFIGKALEMTSMLNQYDEDADSIMKPIPVINKSMSDKDIIVALENFKCMQKRKTAEPMHTNVKRKKESVVNETIPKIVNTFSLLDEQSIENCGMLDILNDTTKSTIQKLDHESKKCIGVSPSSISSFNDSYKDFVDKNFKPKENAKTKSNGNITNINSNSPSQIADSTPKHLDNFVPNLLKLNKSKNNKQNKPSMTLNPLTLTGLQSKVKLSSKTENTDTKIDKNIIDQNISVNVNTSVIKDENRIQNNKRVTKKNTSKSKQKPRIQNKYQKPNNMLKPSIKKKTVKTKMGQFVPGSPKKSHNKSVSEPEAVTPVKLIRNSTPVKLLTGPRKGTSLTPGKTTTNKTPVFNSVKRKSKLDFDYEVKEQDNDCNILILKF